MYDDDYTCAKNYFSSIIAPTDVVFVDDLLNRISKAPEAARRYLEKRCRDVRELEEFFKDNDYLFHLENRRVALFDEKLLKTSERTVEFFKEKLKECGRPVDYMQLKMLFLGDAPRNIQLFIALFYPGKEIKHFFKQKPNIFVVHKDHTVFLIEVEAVEFYRRKLEAGKGKKVRFKSLMGRVSQAEPHIQAYINRNYNDDDFQDFLLRNSDVFRLDDDCFVTLASSE